MNAFPLNWVIFYANDLNVSFCLLTSIAIKKSIIFYKRVFWDQFSMKWVGNWLRLTIGGTFLGHSIPERHDSSLLASFRTRSVFLCSQKSVFLSKTFRPYNYRDISFLLYLFGKQFWLLVRSKNTIDVQMTEQSRSLHWALRPEILQSIFRSFQAIIQRLIQITNFFHDFTDFYSIKSSSYWGF